MTREPIIAEPVKSEYGVGGWLLFLCVIMVIISPIRSAYSLVTAYVEVLSLMKDFPGLIFVTIVDTIFSVALVGFGIYAGLALWRIRPGAVRTAKAYFIFFLIYSIFASFLPFFAGLPEASNEYLLAEMPKTILGGLIYFCIWFAYLSVSKRVKATYPEAREGF